jgi:N6-adenosine-specific RNA methylase IME4
MTAETFNYNSSNEEQRTATAMISVNTLKTNKYNDILPPLTAEQYDGLRDRIRRVGFNDEPIEATSDLFVLDGHNRVKICQEIEIDEVPYIVVDPPDPQAYIIEKNYFRRQLSDLQQSYLRGKMYSEQKKQLGAPLGNENAKKQLAQSGPVVSTSEKLASQFKVDDNTIKRDEKFFDAVESIKQNVGEVSTNKMLSREINVTKKDVQRVAAMDPEQQVEILKKVETGEAKSLVDARRLLRREDAKEAPVMDGKYRVIYADPPWCYGDKRDGGTTGAEDHYPSMTIQELCDLPVKELAEDNAVLFLWVTSPLLEECFQVVDAWGFLYKSSFIWDKLKHNFGHYNSVRHELLLVCTRGSCLPDNPKLYDSVVSIERKEHSVKPEEFRQIIDDLYQTGNRIELFARQSAAPGWAVWGNEAEPVSLTGDDEQDRWLNERVYKSGMYAYCKYCYTVHDDWDSAPDAIAIAWECGKCGYVTADEFMEIRDEPAEDYEPEDIEVKQEKELIPETESIPDPIATVPDGKSY